MYLHLPLLANVKLQTALEGDHLAIATYDQIAFWDLRVKLKGAKAE